MGAAASKKLKLPPHSCCIFWDSASLVRGPVATTTGPWGMSVTSSRTTVMRGSPSMAWVARRENSSRSTARAPPAGTADFSAYLNNAVSGGADVIFAPSAIAYAPQIIEQASALGVSLPILGGDTWENSAISDAQNGTDMQVFVSTFFDENDESGLAKEFVSGYKAWLNGNAQNLTNNGGNDVVAAVSDLGYDAYMAEIGRAHV